MSNDTVAGYWHMAWDTDADAPEVRDRNRTPVARIEPVDRQTMLARTGLIMTAPELYEAAAASLHVFRAMAEYGEDDAALAARDMVPMLEAVLAGAGSLGEITPETYDTSRPRAPGD